MVQVEAATAAVNVLSLALDHDLPVGAAFRAIRSPRSDRDGRVSSPFEANQSSDMGGKPMLTPTGSSTSLEISSTSQDPTQNSTTPPHPHTKDDLAKRAQTRVTERKRTELEKRQEQEKLRVKKQESDRMKKHHDQQSRQQRRAEIYALNAILRQLQQAKIAAFVHTQSNTPCGQAEDQQVAGDASLVQSIGV